MAKSKALTWTTITTKLGDLIEYDKNPVQITEREAKELSKSLLKFNNVIPYVAAAPPNGKASIPLLDGHQRKLVSMQINKVSASAMVEVRVPSRKLTEKEKQELIIRLRKNTGEFDYDKLANFFDVPDLLDWGFSEKELLGAGFEFGDGTKDAEPQIDRAAELLKKWKVKKGDLFQIGDHRLICGDCTDAAVVARVMDGEKADMIFEDPPYNIAGNQTLIASDVSKSMQGLKDSEWDKDFDIKKIFPVREMIMGKSCTVYICTSKWILQEIWEWMAEWSSWYEYCVWCKPNPMPTLIKRHWTFATELIAYGLRGKYICNFPETGHALNWWDIAKKKDTDHPTEKVLEVPSRAIAFSSNPDQIIFDGFCGSGTTLVACENLGRRGRAVEISPAYCAVTLQRMRDAFPDIEIKRIKK